ncbi:TauD/TfdA family dioxygenase [Pseudomonas fluorescens]|uniref:TauD/TfdA family dioxygenase n=1 Tax=Pseudomonas fluorescens TaxID=294 RepID=UPI001BE60D7C|nr:TauD/TfdA family dioxygenase [Pseudomonas fluorescens]MBT2372612.1 TauD/TfdA family dioxygenase [Pseudomonas fluorescens]
MSKQDAIFDKSTNFTNEELLWRPTEELAKRYRKEIPQIHISFEEQRTFQAGLASLAVTDSSSGIRLMPALGQFLENSLSAQKVHRLRAFPESNEVAIIIRGLPLDIQLPSTPYNMDPDIDSIPVLAGVILSVLQALQVQPVAYEGESEGTVFRHVAPKHKAKTEKSSYGSHLELGMHVDNPHLPLACEPVSQLSTCPEYLSLTGLRCDLSVPTRIVDIGDVLAMLSTSVEEELSRPHFTIRRPASFGKQGDVLENVPLLYRGPTGDLHCRYNRASVIATCPRAKRAMELFDAAANHPDVTHHILLQPGDMLIFKNQKVLHARDGFTPRYDGQDRWMIRAFGVSDLARVIPMDAHRHFIVRA